MMADDKTLIKKNQQSIINAIKIFSEFEICSGYKLNLRKTEIIPVGNQKDQEKKIPVILQNNK